MLARMLLVVGLAVLLASPTTPQVFGHPRGDPTPTQAAPAMMRAMPLSTSPQQDPRTATPDQASTDTPRMYTATAKGAPVMSPSAPRNMRRMTRTLNKPPVATGVLSPSEITSAAKDLMGYINQSESEEEYKKALTLYEEFKKAHKDSGVCLPQAPDLIPSSFPKKLTPIERDCKIGYRIGWKHGKKWAQIVVRDNEKKEVGEDHLKCLISYIEPGTIDPKVVCAYKAARKSYEKWYKRLTDPKARADYQSYRNEEPSTVVEFQQPKRRRMTPSEAEFVQSLGLTPDLA